MSVTAFFARFTNKMPGSDQLARRFVNGKLSNQRQRLLRYNRSHQDEEVSQAAQQLTNVIQQLITLSIDEPGGMQL